jgi:hypothetical protein
MSNFQLLKRIFNSFCTSFYGVEGVDANNVSAASVRFFRKSVNLALMKMLRLPRESVSPHLIAEGILNADSVLKFRSILFWRSLLKSRHPFRGFLLMNNSATLFQFAHQLKLLPGALPYTTRDAIQSSIILGWMELKELV